MHRRFLDHCLPASSWRPAGPQHRPAVDAGPSLSVFCFGVRLAATRVTKLASSALHASPGQFVRLARSSSPLLCSESLLACAAAAAGSVGLGIAPNHIQPSESWCGFVAQPFKATLECEHRRHASRRIYALYSPPRFGGTCLLLYCIAPSAVLPFFLLGRSHWK